MSKRKLRPVGGDRVIHHMPSIGIDDYEGPALYYNERGLTPQQIELDQRDYECKEIHRVWMMIMFSQRCSIIGLY